jgi:two-component system phosphate regulon sensor histidine kinase PhoR
MRTLALAFGLAAVPVSALAVMLGAGWAAPVPASVAIVLTLVTAVVVALIWTHDLDAVTDAVRRVAAEGSGAASYARPALTSLGQLSREVERLSRRFASRTALVEQLQRADAAIVERLPDPLIVLGADRSVRRANAAARVAFGSDIGAVLRHPGLRGAIDRAFASGNPQGAELIVPVPVPREVQAAVVPMDPPLADGGRAVVVLSDRTRERAVERMRADFVANASHELRTPLASLSGFIDTLQGPARDDAAARERFIDIMKGQARRMARLIDDLLSLSRIELNAHLQPQTTAEVASVVRQVADALQVLAEERGVAIAINAPAEPLVVIGDRDELTRVFENLIENALKYGGAGKRVDIDLERKEALDGGGEAVVAVRDYGAGIAAEHLPRLTERFYRVDVGHSRAEGGTGLGLALVKHILTRHRGRLQIESTLGQGATFTVRLPLSSVPARAETVELSKA